MRARDPFRRASSRPADRLGEAVDEVWDEASRVDRVALVGEHGDPYRRAAELLWREGYQVEARSLPQTLRAGCPPADFHVVVGGIAEAARFLRHCVGRRPRPTLLLLPEARFTPARGDVVALPFAASDRELRFAIARLAALSRRLDVPESPDRGGTDALE